MRGTWNSTLDPSVFEVWRMDSTSLNGIAFKVSAGDTTFLEKINIIETDSSLVFVADIPENEATVFFYRFGRDANRLWFKNMEHDFPKEISYQKIGHNSFRATVSGNGVSNKVLFIKR